MELKLYNRLKHTLLGDFVEAAENNDSEYQRRLAAYAPQVETGLPQPAARDIKTWLDWYNRLTHAPVTLRYYQILALYFTRHVLNKKRERKAFIDQKALVYWMATGSGKTLLMHLNILQYIEHIGGLSAFDELQIILTTPGVNLIAQHERELRPLIGALNRACNNRFKLTIASTAALLNRPRDYFNLVPQHDVHRLVLVDEGHIGLTGGASGASQGAFKQLRDDLLAPDNAFLFEYSATYHGISKSYEREYEDQIVYDYNYYRFFKDGYGKDYALQNKGDDRFEDAGWEARGYFDTCFETLADKLRVFRELTVRQAQGKSSGTGDLPFTGQFPDKPLLAFMGNTVDKASDEGKGNKDEVSDIRKILAYLARLPNHDKQALAPVFNNETNGLLTLTRCPGVAEEIWLSWGDGRYWGIINVGNGDKFFADSENHPSLMDSGAMRVNLRKAPIVPAHYHFEAIDDAASPINVLIGSRKFAEGWNCFRVSIIGLVNLGSSKGNKIIQIYGRGVRLKGLRGDGKRHHFAHNDDYGELLKHATPAAQLQRLETLNVYSLKKSYLDTFLKALEADIPFTRQLSIDVAPAMVKIGKGKEQAFATYHDKLPIFRVGETTIDEREAPLRVVRDAKTGAWDWQYRQDGALKNDSLPAFTLALDYRPDGETNAVEIQGELKSMLEDPQTSAFLPMLALQRTIARWGRQNHLQIYWPNETGLRRPTPLDLVKLVGTLTFHKPLDSRPMRSRAALLEQLVLDVLDKIRHKVIYDISKREYRFEEPLEQTAGGHKGDFIDRYNVTCEFADEAQRSAFDREYEADPHQFKLDIEERAAPYHVYKPLLSKDLRDSLKQYKLKRLAISPDSLNAGERKFLRDILAYLEQPQFLNSNKEYYLLRNVESLRRIGMYLEGETRSFYPDFVLWRVDTKTSQTDIVFFDPKGESGIVDRKSMAHNQKVAVATNGQLAQLALQLQARHKRPFTVHSFLLLRDSSEYGDLLGQEPSQPELDAIRDMQRHHVLRLNWHENNENGDAIKQTIDGQNYLDMAFDLIG